MPGSNGMPIGAGMTRLRKFRERLIRNRSYGTETRPAGFETLRYKTGWIRAEAASDGSWYLFEFLDGVSRPRGLPRRHDRIRMKTEETIYIMEFGAKGERRREHPPTLQQLDITGDTGTRAEAGGVYTVADIRLESAPGKDRQLAWAGVYNRGDDRLRAGHDQYDARGAGTTSRAGEVVSG